MTRKKLNVFGLVLTSLCALGGTVVCIVDFEWWSLACTLLFYALVFLQVYLTKKQKVVDHTHPNNHYPDIAEGSKPPTMKHGEPIENMVWWYAAIKGWKREDASANINAMDAHALDATITQHQAYLELPKFDTYFGRTP